MMQYDLLSYAESKARDGMERALTHAEKDVPGWAGIAYSFLLTYARHHETFTAEQLTDDALNDPCFPRPETAKAFGTIFRKAMKANIIAKSGEFARRAQGNGALQVVWKSRIYSP
jgi:hypothetical protein